jgi:GT2 family glycosyltransferase
MSRSDSIDLSVIIPFYNDFAEAVSLGNLVRDTLPADVRCELILVRMDPRLAHPTPIEPNSGFKVLSCSSFCGLPAAKNLGLETSTGEFVLFLFPGLRPEKGAIEYLVKQLRNHTEWGSVGGRWNNEHGKAEKGYNVRRIPSFLALVFDVLFINKLFPGNRITRRYKMHDFDHHSRIEAEHVNDCVFMSRRSLLMDLGKFNETYRFAWFDQIEMCVALSKAGRHVYYEPDAVFTMVGQPLVNRVLVLHYRDYYEDLHRYVTRHFQPWQSRVFKGVVFMGMGIRLLFSRLLPRPARMWLLRHYRSYASDEYIQSMSHSYENLLKS